TASIGFLGNFATFDASCLFLLALSSWIMVRTATSRWPLFLLAAPVAALAVATKYAGLLFVPTIALLPVLTAWPYHRRRVFAYPVIFGVAVAALLYGALRLGGHSYIAALQQTTTSRAQGDTPVRQIGWEFIKWGGLQFGVAVLGAIAYAWRPRTDLNEQIAPAGTRLRRILLGFVLVGTALLDPPTRRTSTPTCPSTSTSASACSSRLPWLGSDWPGSLGTISGGRSWASRCGAWPCSWA
ncbi:MAG: hypothetical protein ACLPQY_16350, partial [Streptosporangiaceae bacterium]